MKDQTRKLAFTKERSAAAQKAIVAVFFVQGFVATAQIPRIPEIIEQIGVDFTTWGIIMGLSILGGVLGLIFTSRFIARFGTKRIILVGGTGLVVLLASIGFIQDPFIFFLVQVTTAFLFSIFNIASNSQTVALQKAMNKIIIGKFHAAWAMGAAGSSAFGGFMATFMPLWLHLLIVAAFAGALFLYYGQELLSNNEDGHGQGKPTRKPVSFFKSPNQVWLLSAGLFTGVMCELTMSDWSALFSQRELGFSPGTAAIPFTAFSGAMIIGRLLINPLGKRWHLSKISQIGGIFGSLALASGIVIGILYAETNPQLALLIVSCSFFITGLGVAPLVPSFFSLAGSVKGLNTAQVLARMSMVNTLAIVFVKILMGASADGFGVTSVFIFAIVAMFACGILAGIMVKRSKNKTQESAYPATGAMSIVSE